jgi:hypothetical protein
MGVKMIISECHVVRVGIRKVMIECYGVLIMPLQYVRLIIIPITLQIIAVIRVCMQFVLTLLIKIAIMNQVATLILSLLLITTVARAQTSGKGEVPPFVIRGYVKEMPALSLNKDFADASFMNILHNRLNFRWNIARDWHFAAEGRNRLFYNELFNEFPMYKDILEQDPGLPDMSWVWLSKGSWIGHTNIDRFYLDWHKNNWQVRVGRQRINWGVNLVSNPNDLFNTYSFFDFDYPERPGADAVRVQHFFGDMSRVQVAVSPARNSRKMVAAAMLNLNLWGYDFQALAGYYRNRLALGGGWAGNIGGAGFKGEATWFYDVEEIPGTSRGNLVAAFGFDYMFGSGTYALVEFLYNGGYQRIPANGLIMITQPLRPDNIMFSEFAITLSAQHPFSSVFGGGLSLMALPDIEAAFVMPSLSYSVLPNLDLEFVSQIFIGGKNSIFEEAGSSWFLGLQYSF